MPLRRWKTLNSKTVIKNNHWSYYYDEFEIEDGTKGEYHYVHTLGSSMIIPVTSGKKIIMVNQYRYLNKRESLEFPCGLLEESLTSSENAIKELREETGFSAGEIIQTGKFSPYTGASDEICSVFIGTGLSNSPLPKDKTEEFELNEYTFEEIEEMITKNIIWDGMTIATWALSKNKIKEIIN